MGTSMEPKLGNIVHMELNMVPNMKTNVSPVAAWDDCLIMYSM